MPSLLRQFAFLLLLSIGLLCGASARAHEEDAILVGRNLSSNLVVEVPDLVLPLSPSIFPGISGYATGIIGVHSAPLDEPDEEFFQLSPAGDFQFILVGKDAGIEILNDHGSGFMQVGETFFCGPPPFDTHPIWNITTGTPGHTYSVVLKMHDVNGVYSDSDPFSVNFTPAAPALLSLTNLPPDSITLAIAGTPHAQYILQASDLSGATTNTWSNLATNEMDESGLWIFSAPRTNHVQRFFRALLQ